MIGPVCIKATSSIIFTHLLHTIPVLIYPYQFTQFCPHDAIQKKFVYENVSSQITIIHTTAKHNLIQARHSNLFGVHKPFEH